MTRAKRHTGNLNRHTVIPGNVFRIYNAPRALLKTEMRREQDFTPVVGSREYAVKHDAWDAVTGKYRLLEVGRWHFNAEWHYWYFRVRKNSGLHAPTIERLEKYIVVELDPSGKRVRGREAPRRSTRLVTDLGAPGQYLDADAVRAKGGTVSYRPKKPTRRPDMLTFMEQQAERGYPITVTLNKAS